MYVFLLKTNYKSEFKKINVRKTDSFFIFTNYCTFFFVLQRICTWTIHRLCNSLFINCCHLRVVFIYRITINFKIFFFTIIIKRIIALSVKRKLLITFHWICKVVCSFGPTTGFIRVRAIFKQKSYVKITKPFVN